MPALHNPRHERFAQAVAKGMSNGDASVYAGYAKQAAGKDHRSNASRLHHRQDIQDRIRELQEKAAKKIGATVADLVDQLDEMYFLAKRMKQPSAGVGATLAKGKLLGLILDKPVEGETVRKPASAPTEQRRMTMSEWQAKFAPGTDRVQ